LSLEWKKRISDDGESGDDGDDEQCCVRDATDGNLTDNMLNSRKTFESTL